MNVAVIDIGSPRKNNIGWAIVGPQASAGTDLDAGVAALAEAVHAGPLALGFEAPMFVPMRERPETLANARDGERDRAFSASAGASVLVTATVVVPYVLGELRRAVPDAVATLNWRGWPYGGASKREILLFEAFVSHKSSRGSGKRRHVDDAGAAADALHAKLAHGESVESAVTVKRSFSLLGAMMVRTGWTNDVSVLAQPCLVINPISENGR